MCIGSRYVSLDHVENLPILWFAMLWKQLPSLAIKLKLLFFQGLGTSLSRTRRRTTWARVTLACNEGGFACFNAIVYHYALQKLESAPRALFPFYKVTRGCEFEGGSFFVVVFLFLQFSTSTWNFLFCELKLKRNTHKNNNNDDDDVIVM